MSLLMAGLSPHPPLAIPDIGQSSLKKVSDTIKSLKELGHEIVESDPELLITISPHGAVMREAISIIDQEVTRGDFRDFGYSNISFAMDVDLHFIDLLKKNAAGEGLNTISLQDRNGTHLDHGVLVPLYYLKQAGLKDIPLVAINMTFWDYSELYKFGKIVNKTIEECDVKAVAIASGDLSHKLKPGAPAGYDENAEKFDKTLVKHIKNNELEKIKDMNKGMIHRAGECGHRPMVILTGILSEHTVETDLKSYEGPFGVGYAVASFKVITGGNT
ncbi:MAG: AmmeMemoRadiSam system protein B [Halanaerobiales bacterium]|nr:AmmeMemoRadiSam system protein B [Halanaerobiales bacterium]